MTLLRYGLAAIIVLHASAAPGQNTVIADPPEGRSDEDPAQADGMPDAAELERAGAIIGEIIYERRDVFDTSSDEENKSIFRLANRLHIDTRRSAIRSQLLFRSGEAYSQHKLAESERLLRENGYLFDASVRPTRYRNGVVDVTVMTRDNWTLFPELSYSRSGGKSETIFGFEEENLLGTGSSLTIKRENDVDRSSSVLEFFDRNVGRSWVRLDLGYSDSDDGDSQLISVQRPFFALDTRWSAGLTLFANDRVESLHSRGDRVARFRQDEQLSSGFFGWSPGLVNGWTRRWSAGLVAEDHDFSPVVEEGLVARTPESRRLVYPFVSYQAVEDSFEKSRNLNQIGRTEDVYLGTRYSVSLGYATESMGSDRDAIVVGADYGRGFGSPATELVLFRSDVDARIESGNVRNALLSASLRYFRRQSDKRLFYAATEVVVGSALDTDTFVVLDGDTGLRGYPFRYLNGKASALITVEQRYYTDLYPFRLFRVGGAIFFDAGRVWGSDTLGRKDSEILTDVGIGLRLGSTRSGSNKTFHIDLAFPLNADSSIDSVQVLFEGKRSF